MASFSCIHVNDLVWGGASAGTILVPAKSLNVYAEAGPAVSVCAWSYAMTNRAGSFFGAVKAHDYLFDQILNRIWYSPKAIDAGFITDDTPYDVNVWNAFRNKDLTVSGVTPSLHDGVSFPVRFPVGLLSMQEKTWTLTVTEKGPAIMDMVFAMVMDEESFPIRITCMRVFLMTVEPDWSEGIGFSLAFDTVVSTGKTLREQRRPLIPVPMRKLSASFVVEGLDDQMLLNKVSWCHDKMVGVPLYHEPVYVDDVGAGDVAVSAVSDIAGYINLNTLCSHVILINRVTGVYGLYEIQSVSGQDIVVTKPVTADYPESETVVYPVFFALITGADFDSLNTTARDVRLTFEEYSHG